MIFVKSHCLIPNLVALEQRQLPPCWFHSSTIVNSSPLSKVFFSRSPDRLIESDRDRQGIGHLQFKKTLSFGLCWWWWRKVDERWGWVMMKGRSFIPICLCCKITKNPQRLCRQFKAWTAHPRAIPFLFGRHKNDGEVIAIKETEFSFQKNDSYFAQKREEFWVVTN